MQVLNVNNLKNQICKTYKAKYQSLAHFSHLDSSTKVTAFHSLSYVFLAFIE